MGNTTNNGKRGGALKGDSHDDDGIQAIVTDTGQPVELEGGEIIINKAASKKHCKELSIINQSAGGGVAIPCGNISEVHSEFKTGGQLPQKSNMAILDELNKAKGDLQKGLELQDIMKKANAILRKKADDSTKVAALVELGLSKLQAEKLLEPDFARRTGFPSYKLSLNNANNRRLADRVDNLQKKRTSSVVGRSEVWEFTGGTIENNYDLDRTQILFDEKPEAELRTKLKKSGWRWSPTNSAWQRKITDAALYSAKQILQDVKSVEAEPADTEYTKAAEAAKANNYINPERQQNFRFKEGDIAVNNKDLDEWEVLAAYPDKNEIRVTNDGGFKSYFEDADLYTNKSEPDLKRDNWKNTFFVGDQYWDQRYDDFYTITDIDLYSTDTDSNATLTMKYNKGAVRTESATGIEYNMRANQHYKYTAPAQSSADSSYEIERKRQIEQGLIDGEQEGISIMGMMKGKDNPVFPSPPIDSTAQMLDNIEQAKPRQQRDENGKVVVSANSISLEPSSYKNLYDLNKAIESWITLNIGTLDGVNSRSWTVEEKTFLKSYSGYGGLGKFGTTTIESLFEFYTPKKVIEKMWALAYKYGYSSEKSILETSVGTGEFLQYAKPNARQLAYEINPFSAIITKVLYPTCEVLNSAFERRFIKNNFTIKDNFEKLEQFDLVIGNPPYGDFSALDPTAARYLLGMGEKKHTGANNYVEYFLRRSLDCLKSKGLLIMIVGAEVRNGGTMFLDGKNSPVKEYLNENAELLVAYRLPDTIFERTGVTSEILVIQKR